MTPSLDALFGSRSAAQALLFTHPDTDLFLEFPPAPLRFGSRRVVQHEDIPQLETPWGPLRIVTPTMCVMDRLAADRHQAGDRLAAICDNNLLTALSFFQQVRQAVLGVQDIDLYGWDPQQ